MTNIPVLPAALPDLAVQSDVQTPLSALPFSSAAALWFEQHLRYIKPNTARSYRQHIKILADLSAITEDNAGAPIFGEVQLRDITINHIRKYQDERKKRAGGTRINSELSVLQMIMKEARLWKYLEEDYRPLPVPRRCAGHSLDAEAERRRRDVALGKPKWRLAGHCITVMLSTTMGFGELRLLRRGDVDMERRCVSIGEGKNVYRERTIPLNTSAYESMTWIIKRWEKLGGTEADQYILPHNARRSKEEQGRAGHKPTSPPLFDEPMGQIYRSFRSISKAAGLPHFRIYDCRVQAITKLLSNPAVSTQVSKEIAGHISQKMQDRYSIQRFETKRAALDALENPSFVPVEAIAPPAPESPSPTDIMNPAIQAEIARQVALALRRSAMLRHRKNRRVRA